MIGGFWGMKGVEGTLESAVVILIVAVVPMVHALLKHTNLIPALGAAETIGLSTS